MRNRDALANDAFLHRRCHQQNFVVADLLQRQHLFLIPAIGGDFSQLRQADLPVGFEHVADLIPRRIHVFFLIGDDDIGTETGGAAPAWIEVEFVQPVIIVRCIAAIGFF